MINDLIVKPEILEVLFLPASQATGNEVITMRLNNNKILYNPLITSEWEKFYSDKTTYQLWQDWLTSNVQNANGSLKKCKMLDIEETEKDVYLLHSQDNCDSLLIGDYPISVIRENPDIIFLFKEDMRSLKLPEIKIQDIKDVIDKKGRIKKWFSVFETKIDVQVEDNQDAMLLAEYISKFIKGNEITIQDLYLVKNKRNEDNFKNYILPFVKDKKVTINIATEDGAKHKARLEKAYGVQVKSYPEVKMHQSFIEDENYRVRLGFRLEIFGVDGKTRREIISIIRK